MRRRFLRTQANVAYMVLKDCYKELTSPENVWLAWLLFRRGKRSRQDVREFEHHLEANMLSLRRDLIEETYVPGGYRVFTVHDPKRRTICAPGVRDQVAHQAVWNVIFPFFNSRFSPAVYSSRPGRGTHNAILEMRRIARRLGVRRRVFVLHIDVVKFFDSISHDVLRRILHSWIRDGATLRLLDRVIASHDSGRRLMDDDAAYRRGVPLGNLTSQLFCNVFLMPFDHAVTGTTYVGRYVRYADDSFFLSTDRQELEAVAAQATARLCALRLECRMRIRPYCGFEALGARFFHDGVAMSRNTASRAKKKLLRVIAEFQDGLMSATDFNGRIQSWHALPVCGDRRWTDAVREAILYS